MKIILFLALATCLLLPAHGMYMRPDLKDIPLQRLLTNLTESAAENPQDAAILHHLARTHAMAYASKLADGDEVKTWAGWRKKDPVHPWFGFEPPHVPFNKVTPTEDQAKSKAAAAHLAAAIATYKKALALKTDDTAIQLGLAWCQDQAGEKEAAMKGYRKVLASSWDTESKRGGGLGNFVYIETAGYLLPHLDAEQDAKEIKEMENRKAKLLSFPRAITPILVPVTAEVTDLDDLVDRDARVGFDLDGSGRQLEWPWLTPNAAWLVHDPRGEGKITSAIQMFGSRSFLLFCANGYDALALLDNDRNGTLRGAELTGLALWHDRNGNGVSDTGEVQPLAKHGITALSTNRKNHATGIPFSPTGATYQDGTTRPTYDLVVESQPNRP